MAFTDKTFADGKAKLKKAAPPASKQVQADPEVIKALEGIYRKNSGDLKKIAAAMGYNEAALLKDKPASASAFAIKANAGAYTL